MTGLPKRTICVVEASELFGALKIAVRKKEFGVRREVIG